MNTREILAHYAHTPKVMDLFNLLKKPKQHVHISGIAGSFKSFLTSAAFIELDRSIVYIASTTEEARYVFQDMHNILGKSSAFFLPPSFVKSYQTDHPSNNAIQERSEILLQLRKSSKPMVLVASIDSIAEKVIGQENLEKNQFQIGVGEVLDFDFMIEVLNTYGFNREDFVYEPGQYSMRGGIVDIFSFSHELPMRIELDGRMVESIRQFDPITQLSTAELKFSSIVPNLQEDEIAGNRISIFDYFAKDTLFFASNLNISFQELKSTVTEDLEYLYDTADYFKKQLTKRSGVEFGQIPHFRNIEQIAFDQSPQKTFGKNFNLLIDHLQDNDRVGIDQHIFSETGKQIERLETIFEDLDSHIKFHPVYLGLSSGFVDKENHLAIYTEHEIFGRHYQFKNKHKYSKTQALTLRELSNLKPGDFIVHIDHGVGRFEGLQKIEMGGRLQESVRISYRNNDLLYVNIGSLHK
ncbi:MAG: transcription-repair coupling factor (superfamily II helicase), partial [Bacteroidia bacterium]